MVPEEIEISTSDPGESVDVSRFSQGLDKLNVLVLGHCHTRNMGNKDLIEIRLDG